MCSTILVHGSFMSRSTTQHIARSSVVIINNVLFEDSPNIELTFNVLSYLSTGAKEITTKPLFMATRRSCLLQNNVLREVYNGLAECDAATWTSSPIPYFIYTGV